MFTSNKMKEKLEQETKFLQDNNDKIIEGLAFFKEDENFKELSAAEQLVFVIDLIKSDIPFEKAVVNDKDVMNFEYTIAWDYLDKNVENFNKLSAIEQKAILDHIVSTMDNNSSSLLSVLKKSKIVVNVTDTGYSASVVVNNDSVKPCCGECQCSNAINEPDEKEWASEEQMRKSFDIKTCCNDVLRIMKNNNGILDKTVLIRKLNHFYRKVGAARFEGGRTPIADECIRKEVISHVTEIAEKYVVLQWRNLIMTRKGYNRIMKMFKEINFNNEANELGFALKDSDKITYPKTWDM